MQSSKQLVHVAQQRALAGFGILIEHTLAAAEITMAQATHRAGGDEQAALATARSLIRFEGRALRERIERQFGVLLERAMQTMHTDLRTGLRNIRADELSLLDDAVMERQIEVDRLVQRLRDADEMRLGRLNLVIAQLHGVSAVRERENPFRPYLPARALYEAVGEMIKGEAAIGILLVHLSAAMALHVHDYYGAILEVFEQRGVYGKLVARPSQPNRAERERQGWQSAAENMLKHAGTSVSAAGGAPDDPRDAMRMRVLPKLRHLIGGLPNPGSAGASGPNTMFPDLDLYQDAQALRGLMRQIGGQGGAGRAAAPQLPASLPGPAPGGLLDALRRAQQDSLAGSTGAEPLALASQLATHDASREERHHIDLVALLFEFLLEDSLLDAGVRKDLGRLFVPFARAVLAQPAMLQDTGHPAWRLLNRIGSVAAAVDALHDNAASSAVLKAQVRQAVEGVLGRFDGDSAVFADAERGFDAAVARGLGSADHEALGAAILEAETLHLRRADVAARMERLLAPLQTDARVAAFIRTSWVPVLAQDAAGLAGHAGLLADLVWSAQPKTDAAAHAALMRLLPGLVKRLREGLDGIGMPQAVSKAALGELVPVHMDVLANRQGAAAGALDLAALQAHFARIEQPAPAPADAIAWLEPAELAAVLARHGLTADVEALPDDGAGAPSDAASTASTASFKPGMGFEFFEDGVYLAGQLVAAGGAGGAWAFRIPDRPSASGPRVYPRAALLAALQAGTVRTLEYAPVFERAIDALTVSAETLAT